MSIPTSSRSFGARFIALAAATAVISGMFVGGASAASLAPEQPEVSATAVPDDASSPEAELSVTAPSLFVAVAGNTLTGTVTSEGAPVEGLTVRALDTTNWELYTSVTDTEGSFSLGPIAGSLVELSIESGGIFRPYFAEVPLSPGATVFDFTIEPIPTGPGEISGVIRDRVTGDPVPDASVSLVGIGAEAGGVERYATSDLNGAYSFGGLPLSTYSIQAMRFDMTDSGITEYEPTTAYVLVSVSQPSRVRDLLLTPVPSGMGTISGCITDTDLAPLPALSLFVTEVLPGSGGSMRASVMTDGSGCYMADELTAGTYEISFADIASEFVSLSFLERRVTLAADDSAVVKDFVLERYPVGTGRLIGSVTDTRTGLPVEGARVTLLPLAEAGPLQHTVTDVDGRWSFEGLAAGDYEYYIAEPDETYEWSLAPSAILSIADGETVERVDALTSVVAGTGSVSGYVRDAVNHASVPGVEVMISRDRGGFLVEPTVTDENGYYEFESLPAGEYYVQTRAPGYYMVITNVEVANGPTTLNIPLRAAGLITAGDGVIRGAVTDANGDPVYQARVVASTTDGTVDGAPLPVETDADGIFELRGLPLTEWLVTVSVGDWAYAPAEFTAVLTTSEPLIERSVTLGNANTIVGTVDASIVPRLSAEGLEIAALDATTGERRSAGGFNWATGEYFIPAIPDGEYVVVVYQNNDFGVPQTFSISTVYWVDSQPAGSLSRADASIVSLSGGEIKTGVDFTLSEGASISGRVFRETADGVTGLAPGMLVDVAAYRREGSEWVAVPLGTDTVASYTNDSYQLSSLSPGEYRLEFSDHYGGSRSLVTTYNGGGTVFDEAPIITVEEGDALTARDVVMAMKQPDDTPPAIVLDDLGAGLNGFQGRIGLPSNPNVGDTVTITVDEEFAGEWVSVWANSAPLRIGGWSQVSASGTFTVTLPAALVGSHRIAVQDANGALIGWAPVTVVEKPTTPGSGSGTGAPRVTAPTPNPSAVGDTSAGSTPADSGNESSPEDGVEESPESTEQTLASDEPSQGADLWIWIAAIVALLALVVAGVIVMLRRRAA